MSFISVNTYQFRNLVDGETELGDPRIFLIGENGQGKTNFLEVLYLLSFGSSFRGKQEKSLPLQGCSSFALRGIQNGAFGPTSLALKWNSNKKEIRMDETLIKDRKDLLSLRPTILFSHEDFLIVKGEPENQRTFFDQTLAFLDPIFLDNLRSYRKVLRNRNIILKNGDDFSLDIYDQQLVDLGMVLKQRRKALVEECNLLFEPIFEEISEGIKVKILYIPSWKDEDSTKTLSLLKTKRPIDRQMNITTSGPHRDRFRFMRDGKNFSETASTGQIRLISLVLKLVQAHLGAKASGKKPTLLLDDVLLELDPVKRRNFFNQLPEADQAVFTFLPEENLPFTTGGGMIYSVKNGKLNKR